ncbi:MAG: hypothetical protein L0Z62_48875 [Gemmataceae bacterium]|nr:hypothetical protein [Gemmataceae bacterium]
MTFFETLFRTTKEALFGNKTRRPATRVRLTVEALEARAVPAVGKWFPAPSLSVDPNVPAAKELTADASLIGSTVKVVGLSTPDD